MGNAEKRRKGRKQLPPSSPAGKPAKREDEEFREAVEDLTEERTGIRTEEGK